MARPKPGRGNLPAEVTTFIERLTVHAAAGLGRGFAHGGWLVELVQTYLRERELLLVIDHDCRKLGGCALGILYPVDRCPRLLRFWARYLSCAGLAVDSCAQKVGRSL